MGKRGYVQVGAKVCVGLKQRGWWKILELIRAVSRYHPVPEGPGEGVLTRPLRGLQLVVVHPAGAGVFGAGTQLPLALNDTGLNCTGPLIHGVFQ